MSSPSRRPRLRPGPPGGRRDRNRRRRLEALTSAGVKLFLRRGLDGVTIDEIVRAAGIAKGSFYRYFRDASELVEAAFAPMLAQVKESFAACATALKGTRSPQDLAAAYALLAQQLGSALMADRPLTRLYLQEGRGPATPTRRPIRAIADRIRDEAVALSKVARDHGLLGPIDVRVSALAVVGAAERLLFAALSGEDVGDLETVPAQLVALILDGVRAR